jgi:hypothetical protein
MGHAAWAASNLVTERSMRARSGVVDRFADALSRPVVEKLIARAVESAGFAGIRYPERAKEQILIGL